MFITIHQPEHLPWLGFFGKLSHVDNAVLLDNVQFKQHYFENRNKVRVPAGWTYLTVPVLKGPLSRKINEVEIATGENWAEAHWRTIEFNYRKAPYWKEYSDGLKEIYERTWLRLVDLNVAIIDYFLRILGQSTPFVLASSLGIEGKGSGLLSDVCKKLSANRYLSGRDGRKYLEMELFQEAGIEVAFQEYQHPNYRQMYQPFLPGMSTLDLVMNEGPVSLEIIKSGVKIR